MSIEHFFDSPDPKKIISVTASFQTYKGFEIWIVTFKLSQPPNMISVISQPLTPWWDIWKYTVEKSPTFLFSQPVFNWKSIPAW